MNQLPDDNQVIAATFSIQLAIGGAMIALCVLIHGFALFGLNRIMRSEAATEHLKRLEALSFRGTLFTLCVVLALVLVHFVEIWAFAFLYDFLGALPTFEQALYISTISYSTVGFDDAQIAEQWRMIAAAESILGVILLGWSTAFFVRLLGRLESKPRAESGADATDG